MKYISAYCTAKNLVIFLTVWFVLNLIVKLIIPYFKAKKKFTNETKNNFSDDLSYMDNTFLKRKAILDVIKFRKRSEFDTDLDFDSRYKPEPYGLLPSSDNFLYKKNFLVRNIKKHSKITWVKYFFDLEYASYFRGIFNWWFLNIQNLFKVFSIIIIVFLITLGLWIFDFWLYDLTHIRKAGLFFNSFKVARSLSFLFTAALLSLISAAIFYFLDFKINYSDSILWRRGRAELRSEWAALVTAYFATAFVLGLIFRTKKRFTVSKRQRLFIKKFLRINKQITKSKIRFFLEKTSTSSGLWQFKNYFSREIFKALRFLGPIIDKLFLSNVNSYFSTKFTFKSIIRRLYRDSSKKITYSFKKKLKVKKARRRSRIRKRKRKRWRRIKWVSNLDGMKLDDFINIYNNVRLMENKAFYRKRARKILSKLFKRKKRRRRRYLRKYKKKKRRRRKRKKRKAKLRLKKKRYAFLAIRKRDEVEGYKRSKKIFSKKKFLNKFNSFYDYAKSKNLENDVLVDRFYKKFYRQSKVNPFAVLNRFYKRKKIVRSKNDYFLKRRFTYKIRGEDKDLTYYINKIVDRWNRFKMRLNKVFIPPFLHLPYKPPPKRVYRKKKRKKSKRRRRRRKRKRVKGPRKGLRRRKKKKKVGRRKRRKMRKRRRRHLKYGFEKRTTFTRSLNDRVRRWRVKLRKFTNKYHNRHVRLPWFFGRPITFNFKLTSHLKFSNFYEYAMKFPFLSIFMEAYLKLKNFKLINFLIYNFFFKNRKLKKTSKETFNYESINEYSKLFEKYYASSEFNNFLKLIGVKKENFSKSEKFYLKNIFCLFRADINKFNETVSNRKNYLDALYEIFVRRQNYLYGINESKDHYKFFADKLKLDLYCNNDFFKKLSEMPKIRNPFNFKDNFLSYFDKNWWYKLFVDNILGFDDEPYKRFLSQRAKDDLARKKFGVSTNSPFSYKKLDNNKKSNETFFIFLGPKRMSDLIKMLYYKKILEGMFQKKKKK